MQTFDANMNILLKMKSHINLNLFDETKRVELLFTRNELNYFISLGRRLKAAHQQKHLELKCEKAKIQQKKAADAIQIEDTKIQRKRNNLEPILSGKHLPLRVGNSKMKKAGKGVFAEADIEAHQPIVEYEGQLLTRVEAASLNDTTRCFDLQMQLTGIDDNCRPYPLTVNAHYKRLIDMEPVFNIASRINHSISEANCIMRKKEMPATSAEKNEYRFSHVKSLLFEGVNSNNNLLPRLVLYSLKKINAGVELLYDYKDKNSKEPWSKK